MRMLRPVHAMRAWPEVSSSNIFDDFDRLVDRFVEPDRFESANYQAACDISETEDHFFVSLDVPGIQKEDLSVEVKDNQLFVSGERRNEFKSDVEGSLLYHERSHGRFQRSFKLPQSVNPDKIEANYKDGVLELVLAKAEKAKGRKIEIKSGQNGLFSRLLGGHKLEGDSKDGKAS